MCVVGQLNLIGCCNELGLIKYTLSNEICCEKVWRYLDVFLIQIILNRDSCDINESNTTLSLTLYSKFVCITSESCPENVADRYLNHLRSNYLGDRW